MKFAHLRIFVFVMEEGTLAQAAKRSKTSQPAASRLLRLLEADLQVLLFERHKKRLVPTSEAIQLYPEAARILASVNGIPELLRQVSSGHSTPLRIACHIRIADSLVVPALASLSKRIPDLRFHLEVHMRSNLERLFAQELFDVGVGVLPVSSSEFLHEPLCETELQVVVSKSHPLAQKHEIALADLEPYSYIGLPKQTVVQGLIDEAWQKTGVLNEPFHEFSNSTVGYHFVRDTDNYTISDCYSLPRNFLHDLVLIKLCPSTQVRFGLFHNPKTRDHPGTIEFLNEIKNVIKRSVR